MFTSKLLERLNTTFRSGKRTSNSKKRCTRKAIRLEALENRQLMAGDVYISTAGNLVIQGTDNRDVAEVRDLRVNGTNMIRVTLNGTTTDFARSKVTGRISFYGYGDNDRFNYIGTKNVMADGGSGNDFLSGDQGNDLFFGGSGNDTIEGWAGNDELQGGTGNDILRGGAGNDKLFGESGNDRLDGGEGFDYLSAGTGVDEIFANLNQDTLADMTTTRINRSVKFGVGFGGKATLNFSVPTGQTIVDTKVVEVNSRNAFAIEPIGVRGQTSFETTAYKGSNPTATGSYSVAVDVNHVRSGITVNSVRT